MSDFLKFAREYWRHIFAISFVLSSIVGFNVYIVHLANSQQVQCNDE
jgi:hypothetical protein